MGNAEPCGECGQATRRRDYCSSYCEQRAALRACVEALSQPCPICDGSGRIPLGDDSDECPGLHEAHDAALTQAREALNEEPQPKENP